MNAELPESPSQVEMPPVPMLAVLPSVETIVVAAQRFVPAPPLSVLLPNPAITTACPSWIMSSSQPYAGGVTGISVIGSASTQNAQSWP